MTRIRSDGQYLIYCFDPEEGYDNWGASVLDNIVNRRSNTFHKTFTFHAWDHREIPENECDPDKEYYCEFILGVLENDFYRINKLILGLNHDLFIHKDVPVGMSFFVAKKNISIMPKIDKIVNQEVYICYDELINSQSIPYSEFKKLLNLFPNSHELNKYRDMRIGSILKNYFDNSIDTVTKYTGYMEKKINVLPTLLQDQFAEYEIEKFDTILLKLTNMLNDEENYSESIWQKEILSIILLLYPKYIKVLEKIQFKDTSERKRQLDFLLLDFNGYVDIVEIKKPFHQAIVTEGKYRDNHIPLRELSGTVMQLEKYIYYLNKKGHQTERDLTDKYKDELPNGFEIKITNPGGMIIMGRGKDLNLQQKEDFEIIRRKYKSVIDIITYDDLLRRLQCTLEVLRGK